MDNQEVLGKEVIISKNPFAKLYSAFMRKEKNSFDVEYGVKRYSINNIDKLYRMKEKEETNPLFLRNDIAQNESDVWWLKSCEKFCQNEFEKITLHKKIEDYICVINIQKIRLSNIIPKKKTRSHHEV